MPLELLTIKDLHDFKVELMQELKQLLLKKENVEPKRLLRSPEVRKILRISPWYPAKSKAQQDALL